MSSGRSGCAPGRVMNWTIRSAQSVNLASAGQISAAGKRRRSSASSAARSSPSAVMQMPRPVAATKAQPSPVSTVVKRMVSPRPPCRRAPGVMPSPLGAAS